MTYDELSIPDQRLYLQLIAEGQTHDQAIETIVNNNLL